MPVPCRPEGDPVRFGAWSGVRYRIVIDPDWLAVDESHVDESHVYVRSAEHV